MRPDAGDEGAWSSIQLYQDGEGNIYFVGWRPGLWLQTCATPSLLSAPDILHHEMLAICWSLLDIIQSAVSRRELTPASINSDSKNAVDVIHGTATADPQHLLARQMLALYRIAIQLCKIDVYHVKAHEDHPWNTLADHIARVPMRGGI
eukprot:6804019-Pyramimonas_sp.AAC.1